MASRFKNLVYFFIVVGVAVIAAYAVLNKINASRQAKYIKTKQNTDNAQTECVKQGGQWGQCFNSGPCCNKSFSDGGKSCVKGSDCQAGICQTPTDSAAATCPYNFTGDPYKDFGQPSCGQASIDNGKILKDRRQERCVIF